MSGSRFSMASTSVGLLDSCARATNPARVGVARVDERDGGPHAALAVDDWVAQQIKDAYDVERVYRDDDGDIPIPFASSVVFVRSYEHGSPFLELHALLLADYEMSPEVFGAVNAVNAQTLPSEGDDRRGQRGRSTWRHGCSSVPSRRTTCSSRSSSWPTPLTTSARCCRSVSVVGS